MSEIFFFLLFYFFAKIKFILEWLGIGLFLCSFYCNSMAWRFLIFLVKIIRKGAIYSFGWSLCSMCRSSCSRSILSSRNRWVKTMKGFSLCSKRQWHMWRAHCRPKMPELERLPPLQMQSVLLLLSLVQRVRRWHQPEWVGCSHANKNRGLVNPSSTQFWSWQNKTMIWGSIVCIRYLARILKTVVKLSM